MDALKFLFILAIVIYLTIYESAFWYYFFALLVPYFLLTQVLFFHSKFETPKRKSFLSIWTDASDPQIFSVVKVDITKVEEFLKEYSKKVGKEVTYLNFMMKAFAKFMVKYPRINGNINFGKANY